METRYFIDYDTNKIFTDKEVRGIALKHIATDILVNYEFYLQKSNKPFLDRLIADIQSSVNDSIDMIVDELLKSYGTFLTEIKTNEINVHVNSLYKSITKCKDMTLIDKQLDMIYQLKKIELEGDI